MNSRTKRYLSGRGKKLEQNAGALTARSHPEGGSFNQKTHPQGLFSYERDGRRRCSRRRPILGSDLPARLDGGGGDWEGAEAGRGT